MGNDLRKRQLRSGLPKARRQWLPRAVLFGAIALPLGMLVLSRLQADDRTNSAVPSTPGAVSPAPSGLTPLPPVQRAQVPTAPPTAASTIASDDDVPPQLGGASTTAATAPSATSTATKAPPFPQPDLGAATSAASGAAPLSTGAPPITLPPPIQLSSPDALPGPAEQSADSRGSLHIDVIPLNDWAPLSTASPRAARPDWQTKTSADTDSVTPASAAIPDTTSAGSPVAASQSPDDLPGLPPLEVEAARFKQIQPGVTTADELIRQFGEGKLQHRKDGTVERVYRLDQYPRVGVSLEHHRVLAVDVQLEQPTEPETLARRLHFDPDSSVPVTDEAGQLLGQSFPDRGTLFSYDPGTKLVSQMLLEPIDPQPFLTRAAYEASLHPGWGLRDIDYALRLDPNHASSHDLRAQLLLALGRPGEALRAENRSVALSPGNATYLLGKAAILARLDHREEALRLTQSVADRTDTSELLKAEALCQLAELTAGPAGSDRRAIELYMSAIMAAQPLAADEHVAIRRLAKHLLLEAHLGAASDIAWGVWQKKSTTVARWISQADQLAQDLIDHEQGDPQLKLEVARRAVAASAGTDGKWDASAWLQQSLDTGRKLIADADDPLRKQQLQWELGAALLDALEVQRTAGLNAQSLAHAMAVLRYLQSGIQYRQRTAETTYILGRAYFQIGVIHAVVERDHTTAVLWFDRAVPFLDRPLPPSAASRIGRNGQLLVSMGISYWQTGHREEALRLTQHGTDLVAKAVAMKLLDDGALAVPYSNLAAMHRQMGHQEQARSYSEMAARHDTLHR